MDIKRPATYRIETWTLLEPELINLSMAKVLDLATRANIDVAEKTRDELVSLLLGSGGLLLSELGFLEKSDIMNGTVFSIGGLEYVINADGAKLLASLIDSAKIDVVGGGRPRAFSRSELVKALYSSPDFDQLKPRD